MQLTNEHKHDQTPKRVQRRRGVAFRATQKLLSSLSRNAN